jgi:uncharacterized protein
LLVPGAALAATPGVDPALSPGVEASPSAAPSPSPSTAPLPTPEAGRAVYDAAGIWTTDTIDEAERLLGALREDTGTQTAVVSLATGLQTVSETQAIGDAALVMRRFGVGTRGTNDGLVVLFDLDTTLRHGQIRIYPGYDLEAAGLPPDVAQSIFDLQVAPLAIAGDLDGALLAGLTAIDAALRDAAGVGAGTGAGSGPGTGPETAWTPGPDEPVVVDDPGLPAFGTPMPDASDGSGGFFIVVLLLGAAGVALSVVTGMGRGGGDGTDATNRDWLLRNHHGSGPRTGGGSWRGGGGDSGGGGGFGGGGDSGGSGGGGGSF